MSNSENRRERLVVFNGEEVRATLAGRKTQLRRVVKNPRGSGVDVQKAEWAPQYYNATGACDCWSFKRRVGDDPSRESWNAISIDTIRCPYGVPGDRLWVRERIDNRPEHGNWYYAADDRGVGNVVFGKLVDHFGSRKKAIASTHMPRWASRITLEVTGVRVERVQDISADAPWVWVVEFKRVNGWSEP